MLSIELLQALLSPEAGIRDQAETIFRSIAVPERVQALTNVLLKTDSSYNDISLLTAVLLRRDLIKLTDSAMLNELVAPLLQCYTQTSIATLNTKVAIGHSLAEVCSSLSVISDSSALQSNVDPVVSKILSTVVDLQRGIIAGSEQELLSSLKLIAALADRAPMSFARVGLPYLPVITSSCVQNNAVNSNVCTKLVEVIVNGAVATDVDEASPIIRAAAAVKNPDEIVIDEASAAAQIGSHCLLPVLSKICGENSSNPISLELLQSLSHAAVTVPSLFCGGGPSLEVLQAVVQMCLGLSTSENHALALASLQVLASLISVGDVRHRVISPNMAQTVAEKVIPACAQLMAQVCTDDDDFKDWISEPASLVEDSVDDDEGSDDAAFAETLMESFLQNLAGPALTVALPLVRQHLDSTAVADIKNWRHTRAALAILESGLVAAPVALAPHVPEILSSAAALAGAEQQNPRVQYQAIRLLGAICETHPSVRRDHGRMILEPTAAALASPVSKLSSMASQVISSYCRSGEDDDDLSEEENKKHCLVPFLPDLLKALIQGPLSLNEASTGSVTVRVRAMNATACLAEASEEAFCPFYADVMPGLLMCAQLPQVDVATAALQSLAIVGQSVGKEMFLSDATQVLSWIIPVLSNNNTNGENQSHFANEELLATCGRIASVLEGDFAPYADAILPSIYHIAQAPADISIEEGNERGLQNDNNGMGDDGSMTVAIPGRGFQRITINTSAILEKATNNRIMFELSKALGATFGPRVEKTMDIFLPLIKFPYSADVRSTAAQALSALFDSACAYAEEIGDMSAPQHYLPLLSDFISEQIAQEDPSDIEALYALADSLSEVYYIAYRYRNAASGRDLLQNVTMPMRIEVVKRCMKSMTDCLGRRDGIAKILQGNLSGADEEEDYTAQLGVEDSLMTPLVDSIGYLLKFSKAEFVPVFESYVVPMLGKYLLSFSDVRASVAAMCLFDDAVEHCGSEAAAKYSSTLLQGVMVVVSDPNKYDRDLLQAAVYGIAQMSRHAPKSVMSSNMQTIVHQLTAITQGNKEDAGDGIYLYEIAISAMASLVLFGPFNDLKFANRGAITDVFLRSLPLEQDEDEAKICHAGLCSLIESGLIDPRVETSRITKIVGSIISDVQGGLDLADADTCERLMKILYDLRSQNPQGMQQAFAVLDPEIQNVIGYALQDFSTSRSNLVTP
mmetsp:Transcript_26074/g.53613  ORF Transcript_26074/g.53613 Transcript_26074/m.53613 type:complete len:1200 (-) Transcript_26074:141-3740(-)|eukprot:CAMPEP_0201207596 /NCGR_PEP_ID=MMETSP0851-20130426/174768_1 /ASSEMBLY_ACC=CAM_ASM_000631 /TAXON_ID=183588 /ORGANISM="Pseudo-nitzschia fraudulenta, Strain WWA7" /LENGTH=1199 /DNA_ID=CAMNT_0047496055 /DNA_START=351 /DNA_END=3950 /DNA_ORIENTATION=-